ncbi:MAG: response regulator transcription factor [bacterium]|nr:response regulator transcription factor [bacterium]
MKPKQKVLIVEPVNLFRRGLRRILEWHSKFEASEASNKNEALEILKLKDFDCLVMAGTSASMPADKEFIFTIRKNYSALKIVLIDHDLGLEFIGELMRAGVNIILEKNADEKGFIIKLNSADPKNNLKNSNFVDSLRESKQFNEKEHKALYISLTTREIEVSKLWSARKMQKEIAVLLGISANTVRTHIRSIYSKTKSQSRQQLIDFLNRQSLLNG